MLSSLFLRGRRLFTTASLLTIVVGLLHSYGFSQPMIPAFDGAVQVMQNSTAEMGLGMAPSLWEMWLALAYSVSIALFLMGGLGLILAATTDVPAKVLSRTAAVMAIGSGAMTALAYVLKVPPPLLMMGALTLLWGFSMRTTRLA